jgi:hypothetical protein
MSRLANRKWLSTGEDEMGTATRRVVIAEQLIWEWLERQLAERILAAERIAPQSPIFVELLDDRGKGAAKRISRKEEECEE